MHRSRWLATLAAGLLLPTGAVRAETVTVAVAANFLGPLEAVQAAFERQSAHRISVAAGSTGQLYAQIANGAPFDVFLSADQAHPLRLVASGLADGAHEFTYAIGRLALWTKDPGLEPLTMETLRRTDYRWLAIANPELAPYGLAARQTLSSLGLWDALQDRIVRGQSVAQTFAMAETRNAELALVAFSQAKAYEKDARYIEVPATLYEPIKQDAVLLSRGAGNAAAVALLDFLRTPPAARIVAEFGYGVPSGAQTTDTEPHPR